MSRKQADHYRQMTAEDRRIVELTQRLAKLRQEWNEPVKKTQNRWRAEMNPPTSGWKLKLWKRQSGACAYCRGPLWPRYHIDHVIPRALGGPNHFTNYVIACQPCNLSKHSTPPLEWLERIKWNQPQES